MSRATLDEDALQGARIEEIHGALFLDMVAGHGQMAFMLLGRIPNPETGGTAQDLEGAKHFIDQLEMLQFKTRGNLDAEETQALAGVLAAVRTAFAESLDAHNEGISDEPAGGVPPPGNPA